MPFWQLTVNNQFPLLVECIIFLAAEALSDRKREEDKHWKVTNFVLRLYAALKRISNSQNSWQMDPGRFVDIFHRNAGGL